MILHFALLLLVLASNIIQAADEMQRTRTDFADILVAALCTEGGDSSSRWVQRNQGSAYQSDAKVQTASLQECLESALKALPQGRLDVMPELFSTFAQDPIIRNAFTQYLYNNKGLIDFIQKRYEIGNDGGVGYFQLIQQQTFISTAFFIQFTEALKTVTRPLATDSTQTDPIPEKSKIKSPTRLKRYSNYLTGAGLGISGAGLIMHLFSQQFARSYHMPLFAVGFLCTLSGFTAPRAYQWASALRSKRNSASPST